MSKYRGVLPKEMEQRSIVLRNRHVPARTTGQQKPDNHAEAIKQPLKLKIGTPKTRGKSELPSKKAFIIFSRIQFAFKLHP